MSRVMSSQEAEEEADDPPIIFGRGTRTAVFFVLDNHAVLRRETKRNYSVLTSRSIAATGYTIRLLGAKLR